MRGKQAIITPHTFTVQKGTPFGAETTRTRVPIGKLSGGQRKGTQVEHPSLSRGKRPANLGHRWEGTERTKAQAEGRRRKKRDEPGCSKETAETYDSGGSKLKRGGPGHAPGRTVKKKRAEKWVNLVQQDEKRRREELVRDGAVVYLLKTQLG